MSYFINLIYHYGIFAVFFLILIEYACFPISSEIVLPFSGAVASLQHISFLVLLPVSVIAALIGTSFCFLIGRIGGEPILNKIMKRFPKTEKPILSSYEKFEKYGLIAVCVGRVIPLCRTYIAFVAGALKQGYLKFLLASSVGIVVWNSVLLGLGYLFHENWNLVSRYYTEYKHIILIGLVIILISYLIKKFLLSDKKNS
jgi:Uncharacterized membrane-associated protein